MATIDDFISKLKSQLDKPYVYGAADPNVGFDCSGLIHWALMQFGLNYTHQSEYMIDESRYISASEAIKTKGALLYRPGHIVVSLGNGQIIEAPAPGKYVHIVDLYDRETWTRGGIIPELSNTPVNPTQPKETKVKAFTIRDAKAVAGKRFVEPNNHFYICTALDSADFNGTDAVGGPGRYDITVQTSLEGTPGDVIGVRYLLKDGKTWQELTGGPWNDIVIPSRGSISVTSNFKRRMDSGQVMFIQVKSSAKSKGKTKVTNLVSDAFLFVSA